MQLNIVYLNHVKTSLSVNTFISSGAHEARLHLVDLHVADVWHEC